MWQIVQAPHFARNYALFQHMSLVPLSKHRVSNACRLPNACSCRQFHSLLTAFLLAVCICMVGPYHEGPKPPNPPTHKKPS